MLRTYKQTQPNKCDTNFLEASSHFPPSSLLELLDHLARLALAHLLGDRVFDVVLTSENVDETLLLVRRRVVAWRQSTR
jgi:hypothetical protein